MTKNILLAVSAVLLLITQDAVGQFNKGRFLAGGSVGFSSSKSETTVGTSSAENKSTSFNFSPDVGYFVIDNLAVGLAINLGSSRSESSLFDSESKSFSTSVGPFVRYYLPASIFFQASAAFGSTRNDVLEPIESESTTGMSQWGLASGYAWFLNDYVALEPMVGYQNTAYKDKDDDDYKSTNGTFYINAALTVYLGERN